MGARDVFDSAELHTDTFTNSQGWTVVRVTHLPTGERAERGRTEQLAPSVQAQTECIAELRDRVGHRDHVRAAPPTDTTVSRAEFDALVARVNALDARQLPPPAQ